MTSAHQRVKIPFADPALQADIDTHADQFGALFRQSVYLPGGHEHGIPCFSGKNGGGDYGGNPNGNNRHAKRFCEISNRWFPTPEPGTIPEVES